MSDKALAIIEPRMSVSIATDETFNTLYRYAKVAASAKRLSKLSDEAETMFVILAGFEYGFSPMQAIRNIYIVNGKPTVSGQMLLAMINKSGLASSIEIPSTEEIMEQSGATVRMKRKDRDQTYSATFSMDMGTKAGLTGKDNWKNYWWRMCLWRAVSHCASIAFPDVVEGLYIVEEINPDIPVDEVGAPIATIEVKPEPVPASQPQLVEKTTNTETGEIVQPAPTIMAEENDGLQTGQGQTDLREEIAQQQSDLRDGGPMATTDPASVADATFDAIRTGEPEQPALGLVDAPKVDGRKWVIGTVKEHAILHKEYIAGSGITEHFDALIKSLYDKGHISDNTTTEGVIAEIDLHYADGHHLKNRKERKTA